MNKRFAIAFGILVVILAAVSIYEFQQPTPPSDYRFNETKQVDHCRDQGYPIFNKTEEIRGTFYTTCCNAAGECRAFPEV